MPPWHFIAQLILDYMILCFVQPDHEKYISFQIATLEAPNYTRNYILMSSRYKLSLAQMIPLPFQTTFHDFHLFFRENKTDTYALFR
jgi:hypothetical protein